MTSRQRKYQIKNQKQGKCIICAKPVVVNSKGNKTEYCEKHYFKDLKRKREAVRRNKGKIKVVRFDMLREINRILEVEYPENIDNKCVAFRLYYLFKDKNDNK